MADADQVLKVGVEMDVSPLIAGTQKAVASLNEFGTTVQKIAANLQAQGVSAQDSVGALQNMGFSAAEAQAAVAELGATSETTAAQVGVLNTQLNEASGSLERAAVSSRAASSSFGGMTGAMGAARVEMGALTGSTGMMGYGLARVAAMSQTLGPLLMDAFPIFAAIALVAIVDQVATEFEKASDAVMGYTAEVQKAEKADISFSNKALDAARSLVDAQHNLTEANQSLARAEDESFSEKYANAARDHQHAILDYLGPLGALVNTYLALAHAEGDAADQEVRMTETARAQMINVNEQLAEGDKRAITLLKDKAAASQAAMTSEVDRTRAQIAALDEEEAKQRALAAAQETVAAAKGGGKPDLAGVDAQVVAEYAAKRLELQNKLALDEKKLNDDMAAANIESERATGLAQVEARTKSIEQLKSIGQITNDQEATLLNVNEDQKLAIEQKYYSDQIQLLQSEGVTHAAEVKRLQADELKEQIDADAAKRANTAKAGEEDRKAYQALAKGLQEDFLRELEKGAEAFKQEKMQEAEIAIEAGNEQIAIARDNAARLEEINKGMYAERDENLRTFEAKQIAIFENEYAQTVAALTREGDVWRKLAAEKIITEEEASKKLQAIWKEEAKAHDQLLLEITKTQEDAAKKQEQSIDAVSKKWAQDWVQMTNEVLKGQTTIGTALVKMAFQMELQLIDKGIKFVFEKTAEYLLQLLAKHVSFIATLAGIQVAGNTAASAQTLAAKEVQVQILAGEAAAGAFAAAMAVTPFPADFAIATAAASQAAAETEAVGQFDIGGVVPGRVGTPVGATVHGGERVLTPLQNVNLERIANNSTTNNGGKTVHNHTTVNITHGGSNMTHDDMVKAVKVGIRKGQLGRGF